MPDLVRKDTETSAEDCFNESACEGLWGFEAREMGKDVGVGFLGVAYPAGTGRGEYRFLWRRGGGWNFAMEVVGEDLIGAKD